jgi:hypothetical protein
MVPAKEGQLDQNLASPVSQHHDQVASSDEVKLMAEGLDEDGKRMKSIAVIATAGMTV